MNDGALLEKLDLELHRIPAEPAVQQSAEAHLRSWLTDDQFGAYHPQLLWLIEQGRWDLLLDSFYRVLPFGTGGRRGAVGIGPNRFNPWTLASSIQGHVLYLRRHAKGDLSVVVAYDVRQFNDLRGTYNPDLPNPLIGMRSRDFAEVAAGTYAANGVRVHMLPADSSHYVATPELSFAIRHLGASAGLNISASHNHPDDNGGKFYNGDGGQEVPPYDQEMADCVEGIDRIETLEYADAIAAGLISWLPDDVHEAYVSTNVAQSLAAEARGAKIIFTPLHGTGGMTVGEVLRAAGFEVETVADQATPDGAFPNVPFRTPNPEVPESMGAGMRMAAQRAGDVVLACDPDADRIGVCARGADGQFQSLTGNEIAAILAHFKLERLAETGRAPERPLVVKTDVTTNLVTRIAERHGAAVIGDLLVGFKYIGDILFRLDTDGRFRDVEGKSSDFIIGVEESHGILVTPDVRDKDAAGAGILLAELAALQRARGATLVDYLDGIYREFGYFANRLASMVMTGPEGVSNIRKIQQTLRATPPTRIAGCAVTRVTDHWNEQEFGPFLSETDRSSRDVLVFHLDKGSRLTLRPSGTEPKNKTYIEVVTDPLGAGADDAALASQKRQANETARDLADDFTRQMLTVVDIHLPDYALRISDLVPLDKRIEFAERFIPAIEDKARSAEGATLVAWIDEQLASYGKDARGLVTDAVEMYLQSQEATDDSPDRRKSIAAIRSAFA
ncbi:MAG: phosphomannomutase [Phycisphaeraceae bacterium]|nr:phosphomannomutase [Phycisphaeraceae bacterium]